MLLFYTRWNHQKTYRFSDLLRGYRRATPGCNGLTNSSGKRPKSKYILATLQKQAQTYWDELSKFMHMGWMLEYFLIYYLATKLLTSGHCWGVSIANLMLITALCKIFDPKETGEVVTWFSLRPAEHPVRSDTATFRFYYNSSTFRFYCNSSTR